MSVKEECKFKIGDKVRGTKEFVDFFGKEVNGIVKDGNKDVTILLIENNLIMSVSTNWLEHDHDCDNIEILSRINEMRKELIILEEKVKSDDDCKLRMEISDLVRRHRKDFKREIEYWINRIRKEICEDGYSKILEIYNFSVIVSLFEKTDLVCSRDISTGLSYSKKMRKKVLELFNKYGEEKVLLMICEEAKKQGIGK